LVPGQPRLWGVVIGSEAIEVRRWGRVAERYHFRDITALGLGKTANGTRYVGIKLRERPSEFTHQLPRWERECMIGKPTWDAVLPLETALAPHGLLAKCAAEMELFRERQGQSASTSRELGPGTIRSEEA
jgi:hypothetical protein